MAGAYDSVEYHLGLVSYPLEELDLYFADPGKSRLNERDAYIFAQFTQDEFRILQKMAAESDEVLRGRDGTPNTACTRRRTAIVLRRW